MHRLHKQPNSVTGAELICTWIKFHKKQIYFFLPQKIQSLHIFKLRTENLYSQKSQTLPLTVLHSVLFIPITFDIKARKSSLSSLILTV